MKPEAGKLYNAGNKFLKEGNYKAAIDNYDKALNIEKDYRTYYQRGIALKKSGNLEEAKNSFDAWDELIDRANVEGIEIEKLERPD